MQKHRYLLLLLLLPINDVIVAKDCPMSLRVRGHTDIHTCTKSERWQTASAQLQYAFSQQAFFAFSGVIILKPKCNLVLHGPPPDGKSSTGLVMKNLSDDPYRDRYQQLHAPKWWEVIFLSIAVTIALPLCPSHYILTLVTAGWSIYIYIYIFYLWWPMVVRHWLWHQAQVNSWRWLRERWSWSCWALHYRTEGQHLDPPTNWSDRY